MWDAYRRFITMFGDVVMGVERHYFEEILDKYKKKARVKNDTELTADQLKKLWKSLRQFIRKKPEKTFQTIQKYSSGRQ